MKPLFGRGELDSLITHVGGKKNDEKNILENQFKRIKNLTESNPYLKDVKNETEQYIKNKETKRKEKIKHLEILIDYVNRVMDSGIVEEKHKIDLLKEEKRRIQREIKKILKQK